MRRIDIEADGRVGLYGLGDVGHLPPKQITYS